MDGRRYTAVYTTAAAAASIVTEAHKRACHGRARGDAKTRFDTRSEQWQQLHVTVRTRAVVGTSESFDRNFPLQSLRIFITTFRADRRVLQLKIKSSTNA